MSDLVLRTRINATRMAVFTRSKDGEFLTMVIRPIGRKTGNFFDIAATQLRPSSPILTSSSALCRM
jgi:hypothetical protein